MTTKVHHALRESKKGKEMEIITVSGYLKGGGKERKDTKERKKATSKHKEEELAQKNLEQGDPVSVRLPDPEGGPCECVVTIHASLDTREVVRTKFILVISQL